MIGAWGRGFEKIREACALYDGPLSEYGVNEAGIMVLCKACDKYLGLLRDDVVMMILDFCKEAKSVPEIMENFGLKVVQVLASNICFELR